MFELDIEPTEPLGQAQEGIQESNIGLEWKNYKKSIFIFSLFQFEEQIAGTTDVDGLTPNLLGSKRWTYRNCQNMAPLIDNSNAPDNYGRTL